MRFSYPIFCIPIVVTGIALSAFGQSLPFQDESLHYAVNWPSGLSLGEAELKAHRSSDGWDLNLTLDAGIPGSPVADQFHSRTDANLCSQEFDRDVRHGLKKTVEKTMFDYAAGVAHRGTVNGGTSDLAIASHCAADALAYIYSVRTVLARGDMPSPGKVYFGSPYSLGIEYAGQQTIEVSHKQTVADRFAMHLQGPASTSSFEMYFARDAVRTPLLVKIPLSVGTVSLELAP